MADSTFDKLKDQYVELIVHAMPISQIFFVVLMSVTLDRILGRAGNSVLNALSNISLAKIFSTDSGIFWSAPIKCVIAAFLISLLNVAIINFILRRSFSNSRVGSEIRTWHSDARASLQGLTVEQKLPIQTSLKHELEKRLKKYNTKRMFYEVVFSLVCAILYGSAFLVILNFKNLPTIMFSWPDAIVFFLGSWVCVLMHRNSVRFAISKVISLQVALSASTGEIAFFEGIS